MHALRASDFVLPGFIVEMVVVQAECVKVAITVSAASCPCPPCGSLTRRVHSRYLRRLLDIPVGGRRTEMILQARRFFCDASDCQRRVFAEWFDGAVGLNARRTIRLDEVVDLLAITPGGRPAAALSRRLNVRVSNDTLLRIVRRRGAVEIPPPTIVGIDDWAWKRNHRNGTLRWDLKRRKTIASARSRAGDRASVAG